jgi:hypothetical protein
VFARRQSGSNRGLADEEEIQTPFLSADAPAVQIIDLRARGRFKRDAIGF